MVTVGDMTGHTDEHDHQHERIASRAALLDEEVAAGSDDPQAQAEAVLADSDERVEDPEGTRAASTQTPDRTDEHE